MYDLVLAAGNTLPDMRNGGIDPTELERAKVMENRDKELLDHARAVRDRAHAPYSKFKVGAAIVDEAGRIHVGCNVENAAYPLGACAEATAIGAMVSSSGNKIAAIAIVGGRSKLELCPPCGGCRQRIAEFGDANTNILLMDENGDIQRYTLAELLPLAFRLDGK